MITRQTAGTPVKASDVRVFSSFKEISGPWRIEGMFSNWAAPVASNTPQQREALMKETVAGLGINAVVGLLPSIGDGVKYLPHTHGIMVNLGSTRQQDRESLPKFIVYLPPVNFKIERLPATGRLNDQLLEYIQYLLGYGKGYYAYYGNTAGVDNTDILKGSSNPAALSEPIGIAPDYALLCDVDGYDEKGNVVIYHSQTLTLTLTLYDLREKKPVWTRSATGISGKSVLAGVLLGPGAWMPMAGSDDLQTVVGAVNSAIKELPAVKGFQYGGGFFPI
jgi:hypothetical protein